MSDGGGIKQAAPQPIIGADKVARMIVSGLGKAQIALTSEPTVVNGNPALVLRVNGEIDGVMAAVSRTPASPASTTSATRRS